MDIEQRLHESEAKFEQIKASREQHLQAAEDALLEMTKLQGEWRVLQELLPHDANKQATVIDAVPETEKK